MVIRKRLKRQIWAFIRRPWSSCRLGPVGELKGVGYRLGTTCCSAPEPSLWPSNSLGWSFKKQCTSPPSLSLRPTSSGLFSGSQSVRTGLPIWMPWGHWGSIVVDACLHQGWQLGRVWEPGIEGAVDWDLLPLKQDWDIAEWKLCLETSLSCWDRE